MFYFIQLARFSYRWTAACAVVLLSLLGTSLPVQAAEIIIPLTIGFEVLTQTFAQQLYTGAGGQAAVWQEGPCRYLSLDHPQFSRQEEHLRFVSHGAASVGAEILEQCISPLEWRGFIEVLVTPYGTADWQLRFHIRDSTLYDEKWNKGLLTSPIWDLTERFFLPRLTDFAVDLTPPREEVRSLVRVSVPPADTAQVEAVLQSATVKKVEVSDPGVVVHLALTVPEMLVQTSPPPAHPEAPLSPAELAASQKALEQWDSFLVFVVKSLGLDIVDPQIREELFELLLTNRYKILPALTGAVSQGEGDPVRRLFVETWSRLQAIIQEAERRGLVGGKILGYAAFIRAGDALLAIDQLAPGLGIEISADGLRRLARILRPEVVEDPLMYSLEVDSTLRGLFGLPPEPPPVLSPVPHSRLGWASLAYAATEIDTELTALRERLDRWVPEESEVADYRSAMDQLLQLATDRELQTASLEARYTPVYRSLVPTTALQESCWRQFTRKGEEVTYLTSALGSLGLMQVNRYVWRGFYDIEQLKWNAVYNARAGAEILLYYLQKYGIEEGKRTGKLDNIARATYAVYNAGPKASKRYRARNSAPREKKVDGKFWTLYQGITADGEVDLLSCTVDVQEGFAIRKDQLAPQRSIR